MRKLLVFLFLVASCFAQTTVKTATAAAKPSAAERSAEATRLPVRRVVLFKNGVGYFEHLGSVSGSQSVSIDFTTSQLNDVLKSITVIDLGKGRIAGVNYTSVEPLDRQLGSLRMGLGEDITGAQFLAALKGAHVEVRSGAGTVTGRVLSVESREVKRGKGDDDATTRVDYLSLITDGGELRQFEMTPSLGVRILESDMREDVNRYLSVLASGREQDLRRMVINTAGEGSRQLQVSYISEVPVWKSTYRLVLPKDGTKPFIQGWAIVDNTVGEDWKDIDLSLVAGAPQSFVEELSMPTYARRPEVALPETAMLQPQTHEAAIEQQQVVNANSTMVEVTADAGAVSGTAVTGRNMQQFAKLQSPPPAAGAAGYMFRSAAPSAAPKSAALAAQAAMAYGNDIGDLFEYKLRERVTIKKNQSALVPIVQAKVEAEKVTLWNEHETRPLRAVWLKNTSGETLDAGTFNILEDDTFAGEGIMDPIKPGERQLLSYAVDQGVTIEPKNESSDEQMARIIIKDGTMWQTREIRSHRVYVVHNANTDGRDVVIEHAIQPSWKLVSETKPEETTPTHRRFKVHVDAKQTARLKVDEAYPIASNYALTGISADEVDVWIRTRAISPEVEKALRMVVDKQKSVAAINREIQSREEQRKTIADDQARLRENMKALKGSAEEKELLQRYTRQLNAQEDSLDRLKKESEELRTRQELAQADLKKTIDEMSLDVVVEKPTMGD